MLLALQLYGSLVGMFELNNLALTVPAPVSRYKAMLMHPTAHDVRPTEAAAALQEVKPLLDALGDEADGPAQVRTQALAGPLTDRCRVWEPG
jgi:hypothetical protein